MGSRRTLILVAAIAIGAVAAFLVWNYVGGIQDKAYNNAAKVTAYVVKKPVGQGVYGQDATSQGLIVKTEIPKQYYPSNAVRDPSVDITGKVAVNALPVNQIVTTDMFADPQVVQATFADRLEKIRGKDQTAITISVDQVHGVAGLLQPGDFINMMTTSPCGGATDSTGKPASTGVTACTNTGFGSNARMVYQKVQILAIDQTPVAEPGAVQSASSSSSSGSSSSSATPASGNRGLITLIVPATAAQTIASLDPSSLYLTLVPRDYKPTPMAPIDGSKPFPGEDGTQITPYGPLGPGN